MFESSKLTKGSKRDCNLYNFQDYNRLSVGTLWECKDQIDR